MAVSKQLLSALNGKARSAGTFFDSESDAFDYADVMKAEGKKNVRKSKSVNFKLADGTKVYSYCVKFDA